MLAGETRQNLCMSLSEKKKWLLEGVSIVKQTLA